MGSKYRAEIWELVELYLLKGIENITNQENIGIYLLKKLPTPALLHYSKYRSQQTML